MGRDSQPKNRQRLHLERKNGRRAPYDRLLIVCEGKKTEPNYFNEIRQNYRLASTNVLAIPSDYGTQPQQVVDYAYNYCEGNDKWEKVFCVFDRDDHLNFSYAIKSAMAKDRKLKNDQGERIRFYAIPSVPRFELWLFLHFEGITAEISRFDLLKKLKKHMPEYDKSEGDHFATTKGRLETAHTNASKLSQNRNGSQVQNPFTAVDEVVRALMKLAEQSKR